MPKYQITEILEKEMKGDKALLDKLIEDSEGLKEISQSLFNSQDSVVFREGLLSEISFTKSRSDKSKRIRRKSTDRKHSQSPENSI